MGNRFLAPLQNRRADEETAEAPKHMVKVLYLILGLSFIIFIMYSLQDTSYRSNISKVLDTAVDAVESSGKINKGVQDYIRERLAGTVDYANDFSIQYATYSIEDFNNVTVLGYSANGAYIGDFDIPKGNMVRITYKAVNTDLDAMFYAIFGITKEDLVEVKEGRVE